MTLHLVEPLALNECFSDMPPLMMACMDDSWSPDNRLVAVLTAGAMPSMQSIDNAEHFREIYPDL